MMKVQQQMNKKTEEKKNRKTLDARFREGTGGLDERGTSRG